MYTFLLNEIHIKWTWAQNTVHFIAKHSFTVYMIHYLIIQLLGDRFYLGNSAKVGFVLTYVCCFAASLIAAILFDYVVEKILQNPLKKILKI